MRDPAGGGTFRSLRVRNFRLFLLGNLLSATGTWMQGVAAPWLVLQLTGSGVALGVDTGLTYLPTLLFGAWGGLIADRLDNRRVQIAAQVAYAALALTLWVLVATGAVRVWMVFVLSFLTGVVTAVDMPTRQSFYLELVGPESLTNAMSLNTAAFTGTRIVGPAIAGALIPVVGVAPIFLANAASYLAVVAALLRMRTEELRPRERVPRRRGQLREGLGYAWRTRGVRLPLLVMAAVFLLAFNTSVLLPLLAVRSFGGGAGTYGTMLALVGVGSLTGALVLAGRTTKSDVRRLGLLATGMGIASVALAAAPVLPVAWVLLPIVGAASIGFAITGNSTLQLAAADHMRGRVMALYSVVFLGSTPIGAPLAGWAAETFGPRAAMAAGGATAIAAGCAALAAVRRRGHRAPTERRSSRSR